MIVKIGKKLIDKASIIVDDVKSGIVEYSTTGFSSLKQLVTIESHDKAEDITHYFLIPNVHKAGTYILQTHRILPSVLSDNVIQRKVFHLPSKESLNTLEQLIFNEVKNEYKESSEANSNVAVILNDIALSIDENNNKITNGLLVVGGVICVANPVTGIAVIGSSLMPNIIGDVVSKTVKNFADNLNNNALLSNDKKSDSFAKKNINKCKPEIVFNTILSKLEKAINDPSFEPNTELNDSGELILLTYPLLKELFPLKENGLFFSKKPLPENVERYFHVLGA